MELIGLLQIYNLAFAQLLQLGFEAFTLTRTLLDVLGHVLGVLGLVLLLRLLKMDCCSCFVDLQLTQMAFSVSVMPSLQRLR